MTDEATGERYVVPQLRGVDLIKSPLLNKGTAFTREERATFGLEGLLPDHVQSIEEQIDRVRHQLDQKTSDLGRNVYLNGLLDRNETLFYRFVIDNLPEVVPVIYTPTVALACSHWSRIYRRSRGLWITPRDTGRMPQILRNRLARDRPVVVVTDNEGILGIGDQGAGGIGIPVGKLALYTAGAGIHPSRTIPISLDVGTDNSELLADPLYLGYRKPRLRGDEYFALVDEFVAAVREVYPGGLLQWEDFGNRTSFRNLEEHLETVPSFNDDIQGTAAMVVGGLIAATDYAGRKLTEQRVVIVGAGSAGIGIRELIAAAMVQEGASRADADSRIFVLDSRGLVVEGRPDLTDMKRRVAVGTGEVNDWTIDDHPIGLRDVVRNARATVLIGVSGVPGVFDEEVITTVGRHVARPVIMPLSNPTSLTEVTPANALRWTGGRAIVATGSPFPPVDFDGRTVKIGQGNNALIFPGLGLGVVAVGARMVTAEMFIAAARALAGTTSRALLDSGQIYPDISDVRAVSEAVAVAVAKQAIADGTADPVDDVEAVVASQMWSPKYLPYRER
jgi:malic enzyme